MRRLMQKLLCARVRPYYIYQADYVSGTEHLRTTVEKGLEIMESLRGWTSGLAVPYYCIDAPGGGGKIPVLPEVRAVDHRRAGRHAELRGRAVRLPADARTCRRAREEGPPAGAPAVHRALPGRPGRPADRVRPVLRIFFFGARISPFPGFQDFPSARTWRGRSSADRMSFH